MLSQGVAPVAVSFDSDPAPAVRTEPEPVFMDEPEPVFMVEPAPVITEKFALPEKPVRVPVPEPVREPVREPAADQLPANVAPNRRKNEDATGFGLRLLAWSLDAALLVALLAGCIAATLSVAGVRYPLDFLRATALNWLALLAAFGFAYSFFSAVAERTPGMALTRQRLRRLRGGSLTISEALGRAALSLASAALGLSGFVLALFDRRGQTLHDKLSRCVVVID